MLTGRSCNNQYHPLGQRCRTPLLGFISAARYVLQPAFVGLVCFGNELVHSRMVWCDAAVSERGGYHAAVVLYRRSEVEGGGRNDLRLLHAVLC